ncbi:MAG: branched-chain amino acid transporter permease protein [Symbiobacteriaceae bacterium]|nr:branched-chain amino acid transporter permease protein [Symbiobacteriaceae bacterium]
MRARSFAIAGAILGLYGLLELLRQTGIISAYWAQIMDLSLIITISAVGLSLIYGFTGQFSLGHAAFYGVGAYTAGFVSKTLGAGAPGFVLALVAGAVAAGLVALLIGLPILRLRSDYLGIATLGFGVIIRVLLDNSHKLSPTLGGAKGMMGVPQLASFVWIFWLAVGAIWLAANLIRSSYGRACISIREDEVAADLMGVNTTALKTLAFVVGGALAGLAGALYAHRYPFLHPSTFDYLKSLDVLLVVVLGGLGSLTGTVVTAIGWVFLLEWLRAVLPSEYMDLRGVVYALVLIVLMIARPQGLLGGSSAKGGKRRATA